MALRGLLLLLLGITVGLCYETYPVNKRGKQKPGWNIWGGGKWQIPDTDNDNIPGTGWINYPKYGQGELCKLNPRNPGCPGWGRQKDTFLEGKQKPGWNIWGGGKWKIPDTDNDNIPGTGWINYPKYGQAELCKLNPRNPGCPGWGWQKDAFLAGGKQKPGWNIWGGGKWQIPDTDHDGIPGTGWINYPKYGPAELCKLNPRNPGCPGWG